jgi:hypothetical protein
MNGFLNMLKAMGLDPEAMQGQAQDLFARFTSLEASHQSFVTAVDERVTFLEGELSRLKEHLAMDVEEAIKHAEPAPEESTQTVATTQTTV